MGEFVGSCGNQGCFTFGSLFVGLTGGAALAQVTQVPNTKPLYDISNQPIFRNVIDKIPNGNGSQFIGARNPWVRLALQGLGCAMTYSYLECKFQCGHRRTIFDSALAGAITGGAFALRGVPGGMPMVGMGAAGFATYALLMQLIFRS